VFSISNESCSGEVGCGLYLEAAAANHSCIPNASQSFQGKTLSLRCTRPILEGEEITIGIAEIQRPGALRRESLRASYFFECRCERCESRGGRAEDARLEAYACPDKKCPGLCSAPKNHSRSSRGSSSSSRQESWPRSARLEDGSTKEGKSFASGGGSGDHFREGYEDGELNLGARHTPVSEVLVGAEAQGEDPGRFKCGTCGNASRPVDEAERQLEAIQELLDRGKALEGVGQASSARQCLDQALGRAIGVLHRGNWMVYEIYRLLASVCVELQDFESAATYASDGMDAFRACLSDLSPYFSPWGVNLAFTGKV
ncbi:unnamed protein product, partial [Hapterophycus canaliculatus]